MAEERNWALITAGNDQQSTTKAKWSEAAQHELHQASTREAHKAHLCGPYSQQLGLETYCKEFPEYADFQQFLFFLH